MMLLFEDDATESMEFWTCEMDSEVKDSDVRSIPLG